MRIIAIHQPNFAPWLGYFYKIKHADAFVLLDNVEYQSGNANSITNRTKIKTPQGEQYISVPVKKGERLIKDVLVDNAQPWQKKITKTLQQNYAKAAHLNEYFPTLEKLFAEHRTHLSILNTQLIKQLCDWLGINMPIHLASELPVNTIDKNERIVSICKQLGGTAYLSGNGARAYNDEAMFNANGIDLRYTSYQPLPYPQLHGAFVPGLSALDALFNCGDATGRMLE